jgi:predicted amidohydrolase
MSELVRVAAVQMDVKIGDNAGNLARILARLIEAAANGAKLIVFPECALSGYCFTSRDEAAPYLEEGCSENATAFVEACARLGVTGVLGFLEQRGDECHNSALMNLPGDGRTVYAKTHLPTLGVDRFVNGGNDLKVYKTPAGSVGLLICYDIRFPEAVRSLGLQGADIVALPTNWPEGAESSPDFITKTRAWENRVYIVAANRVGVERGRRFIGRSQIVAPSGEILLEAGADEETILYADIDLAAARQKRIVIEPGEWELDITHDRRPELYGALTEKLP